MAGFLPDGTVYLQSLPDATTVGRIDIAGGHVELTDYGAAQKVTLTISENALPQHVNTHFYPPDIGATQSVVMDGRIVTLAQNDIDAVLNSAEADSLALSSGITGAAEDRVEALSVSAAGNEFVYLAATDGAGLAAFAVQPDGSLQMVAEYSAGIGAITGMAELTVDGQPFVLAVSASADAIHCFTVGADGTLTQQPGLAANPDLPINAPQAIEIVWVGETPYVVIAASGSSSLTVLQMAPDGSLVPIDHVIDGLATRFANCSVMESFTVHGHTYLVVAGSDGGASLFTMLPDGRLTHVQTLVDTAQASLAHVTDLAVAVSANAATMFAVSGSDPGLSQFSMDIAAIGAVISSNAATITGTGQDDILSGGAGANTLNGAAGNDIIVDGLATDTMIGGAGADLFVLTPDGATDTILDFQPGLDRLDLSSYGFVYSADDITITSTSDGAELVIGDEVLVLHTANGQSLTAADFAPGELVNIDRVRVGQAPPPDPNTLHGTAGADMLAAGQGSQTLFGYDGDDMLSGGAGADALFGGAGMDIADYAAAAAAVTVNLAVPQLNKGDARGDVFDEIEGIRGSAFGDQLRGDDTANVIYGGAGADKIRGEGGNDQIFGEAGRGILLGGGGDDSINGGGAPDVVVGGSGNDTAIGGGQSDIIAGQHGHDHLLGGSGADRLLGGSGNDRLDGGTGNDQLTGNSGQDVFVFSNFTAGEIDLITDFDPTDDLLELTSVAGGMAALDITSVGFGNTSFTDVSYLDHTIRLVGVSPDELSADVFAFV